jgi:hypothetical protein
MAVELECSARPAAIEPGDHSGGGRVARDGTLYGKAFPCQEIGKAVGHGTTLACPAGHGHKAARGLDQAGRLHRPMKAVNKWGFCIHKKEL